ncbi:MAG: biotin--protein ligase [Candidatus Micrarchaeota archaeon]|nr:biotin--protein ligase [Candidatus Micrarchaeota archaeon]MDE1833791.1 biotin--protein ligase [Candidatus Micrarchaeota archaeon]MDE1859962.1 biotin--protein ligase [Candidatus Micrarchaeota archaeon]
MNGTSRFKVPGGKLVIVKLSYSDKIETLQILGDFFVYPEEALPEIENLLIGSQINAAKQDISKQINDYASRKNIEMVGITPDAIAQAVIMAIR